MSNKKAIEAKLVAAVEKTAALVQGGEEPSQAIAKAAMDVGVPAGHINALVHAYNTGQTNRQRLDGDTVLEKVADFPLADAEQVLEIMYPARVKTAAARHQDTVISTEYAIPPTGILARRQAAQKRAAVVDWRTMTRLVADPENPAGRAETVTLSAPEPYPGDPQGRVKKATGAVQRLQTHADELRRQAAQAFDKMGHTFCELTEYFRSPSCTPIPIVRENAMLLHGDKAEQIIDQLISVTPGLAKMAHNQPRLRSARDLSATGRPYQLITQLVGEIQSYKEAKARYLSAASDAEQQAEVLLRPFVGPAPSPSVLEDPPSSTEKQALGWSINNRGMGYVGRQMGNVARGLTDPRNADEMVQDDYNALTDPAHEQELRDIKTEAMLQYLMTNDPDISGYSPDDVLASYNEIVDAVPRAADQMMMMRTLLKQKLRFPTWEMHDLLQAHQLGEAVRTRDERSQSQLKERELSQQSQQFREQQQQRGQEFAHEQAKFKAEMEHRRKEMEQRKLEAQGIADRKVHKGFLGFGARTEDVLTEQARANREQARGRAEEFRHRQHVDLTNLGQSRDQYEETVRHNLKAEGLSEDQINEAIRHNREQEGQGRSGLWESHRHNVRTEGQTDTAQTEAGRHNKATEGQAAQDHAQRERHAVGRAFDLGGGLTQTQAARDAEEARKVQREGHQVTRDEGKLNRTNTVDIANANRAQAADIARGEVGGAPTLQSQQFAYSKDRDTRSDAADTARATASQAALDAQNQRAHLEWRRKRQAAKAQWTASNPGSSMRMSDYPIELQSAPLPKTLGGQSKPESFSGIGDPSVLGP